MTGTIAYLFVDTNLFVQCRPFAELDWTKWRKFDEVHLMVSRPVQAEIDHQKNRGSDRLGKRARLASSLFREIITNRCAKTVQDRDPTVRVFLCPELKPNPNLSDQLDYRRNDDQLVGIAHAFLQKNPSFEVSILTHDTGPLASAQMVGVHAVPIPDDWILGPESTDAEKKIKELEGEISRLRRTEPDFRVRCLDAKSHEIDTVEIAVSRYAPLTSGEVSELMQRVSERFPIASDFEPHDRLGLRRSVTDILEAAGTFVPPTDEEISTYKNQLYPEWLHECERFLLGLYAELERREPVPLVMFAAINQGTRPATDALVTIEAKGRFEIKPPDWKGTDDDQSSDEKPLALQRPPRAPRGRWEARPRLSDMLHSSLLGIHQASLLSPIYNRLAVPKFSGPPMRDPNGFYYKPDRPTLPSAQFDLECRQWRHATKEENFEIELHFDKTISEIAGALECQVRAANLAEVVSLTVPVRIRVVDASVCKIASNLIEA